MPAAHDERPFRLHAVDTVFAATNAIWYHTEEERELAQTVHPVASRRPNAVGTIGVDINPTDDDDSPPTDLPERYVYFGGRATAGKGMELLQQAMSEVRRRDASVQLVVSGGTLAPATSHDDGVVGAGLVADAERRRLMRGALAVVVPGALESLSMLALEAWAQGRPVLLNGRSKVLAGQAQRSGGAVLFDSAQTLASGILDLVDHPQKANALGTAGRDWVQRTYQWDAVVHRLSDLIERASA
jgi:glycosyltransferase involved in cell wall biosynthesis